MEHSDLVQDGVTAARLRNTGVAMNRDVTSSGAEGLLTLLGLRGVGPHAALRLARRFNTLGEILDARPEEITAAASARALSAIRDGGAWETAHAKALDTLERADGEDVRVLAVGDDKYPVWLKAIPDRPPVVYVKGRLPEGRRYVACIGTREPSDFGVKVTERVARFLAERGWSIVSGLALGVDTLAHRAALAGGGHTVAVLANGLDKVYPRKNARLADEILDSGGAWLSEQSFGVPAVPRNLVQRDRLQSGMSVGTIVMQTDVVGGSMHTVRFTLLQGRLLFAPVPTGRHAEEPKSRGILALSQQSGSEICKIVDARGEYRDVLMSRFGSRPPAIPLSGRDDYDELLRRLEQAVAGAEAGTDTPGNGKSQLDLF